MAGSLFGNYPYDTPTDAFPLKLFREVCSDSQNMCRSCYKIRHSGRCMLLLVM